MNWTYYIVTTKRGQYGTFIRSIKKTTANKAQFCDGFEDCAGVREFGIRARSSSVKKVEAALLDDWGRLGGPGGSNYSPAGGVEVEYLR